MNDSNQQGRYDRAKKRVEKEKGFYNHLTTYIVINIVIIIVNRAILFNTGKIYPGKNFAEWLDWNLLITPVLWGIGLFFHWLWVFKKKSMFTKLFNKSIFSKEWEERKIKEFMDQEDF